MSATLEIQAKGYCVIVMRCSLEKFFQQLSTFFCWSDQEKELTPQCFSPPLSSLWHLPVHREFVSYSVIYEYIYEYI